METTAAALFGLMTRCMRSIAVVGGAELRDFDLSPAQYQILVSLHADPGLAQQELVTKLGVTKGNISQLVNKLEGSGLIERTRFRRSDELTLSPAGRELVGRVVPAHDEFMERRFAALSQAERQSLAALLTRLLP